MPRIPPGIYNIRYTPTVPPPPVGGLFATSDGISQQVSAKALRPPFVQRWIVAPVTGPDPDTHIIILDFIGPRAGWGLGGGEFPNHTRVSLLTNSRQWIIRETNLGSRIYHIIEPSPVLEVTKAVAVDDELLFVNSFPLGVPLPRWEFIPVNTDED